MIITGYQKNRLSTEYSITYNGNLYPPKYTVSLANKIKNGTLLKSEEFGGGDETNSFLSNLGFAIVGEENNSEVKFVNDNDENLKIATCNCKDIWKLSNKDRLTFLKQIMDCTKNETKADVLIFAAGYFNLKRLSLKKIKKFTDVISEYIRNNKYEMNVVFGIDCNNGIDQLAVSVDNQGICGLARKFYPTADEKGYIDTAESYLDGEFDYPRIINVKNKKAYLAICYDSFGLKNQNTDNPGVDYIFNLVHRFDAFGDGNSGDVLFARHGLAGASRQWECPVYAAVCFNNREISESWPTGVMWNLGETSTREWKYSDNIISHISEFFCEYKSSSACIRLFPS